MSNHFTLCQLLWNTVPCSRTDLFVRNSGTFRMLLKVPVKSWRNFVRCRLRSSHRWSCIPGHGNNKTLDKARTIRRWSSRSGSSRRGKSLYSSVNSYTKYLIKTLYIYIYILNNYNCKRIITTHLQFPYWRRTNASSQCYEKMGSRMNKQALITSAALFEHRRHSDHDPWSQIFAFGFVWLVAEGEFVQLRQPMAPSL